MASSDDLIAWINKLGKGESVNFEPYQNKKLGTVEYRQPPQSLKTRELLHAISEKLGSLHYALTSGFEQEKYSSDASDIEYWKAIRWGARELKLKSHIIDFRKVCLSIPLSFPGLELAN